MQIKTRDNVRKIAAVVVTYNRKEILRRNIIALLAQEKYTPDIIVVDNASNDGTNEMIKGEFNMPQIIYRNTGSNLGGAGGFHYGIKEAVQLGYDYIWIMDDDTIPDKNALSELVMTNERLDGKWGFLTSAVYWLDGSFCSMNMPKKTIFRKVKKKDYHEPFVKVKMASFVSLYVKAEIIRRVGLPYAEYFIWTDDYEFTGRISKELPCYLVPSSRVVHEMKSNSRPNIVSDKDDRLERHYYLHRNDVHCYRQYGFIGWTYIFMKDIYTVVDILLHSRRSKMKKIRIVLRGLKAGFSFNPSDENGGGVYNP